MKEVKLNMDAQKKYETIKALVDTNGNRKRAATNLSLTVQHIGRLIKIYKECGKAGFIHGNTNRKPKNALPQTLLDTIILLYRNKYQGFNFKHFHEYLEEEEEIKVSYSAVYKALRGANIYSPKIRKATKKRLKKEQLEKQKLLKNKTNEEIEKNYKS